MGNGIAHVFAQRGWSVTLVDVSRPALERAFETIGRNLERQVKKGTISEADRDATLKRVVLAGDLGGAQDSALIVEAVFEEPGRKFDLFVDLDRRVPPPAILASNTSSVSITEIAARTMHPERVVGMHFMNPVPVMPLVEVIRGLATSAATVQSVIQTVQELGKTPVEVSDYPGFVSNRVLMPMINEAIYCVMEGVATPEAVDTVMKLGMNHPMGPLALADLIGLDVCLAILNVLQHGLGDDKYRPCPLLRKMVAAGRLGRKSGRGFYEYP
jgi:3-hydroxybutyryl-CoA dehydrogenase